MGRCRSTRRRRLSAADAGRSYRVFEWSDEPDAVYPDHSHAEEQSHWIIAGTLELTVRGFGTVTLNPGDPDFMPAGTTHSPRVVGSNQVVRLIGLKR